MINRICYDFVLRETWHPEFSFKKMLKSKVPQWSWIPTMAICLDSNTNLSHMLLIFTLSFVKLLWPLLRFSSCTHDQDLRTPTNKMLTLTLKVTQKHVVRLPKIKTPFICHESFSPKFFICRKEVWGYAKKKRDTWSSQNSKRKKGKRMEHMKVPKYWKKGDNPYF